MSGNATGPTRKRSFSHTYPDGLLSDRLKVGANLLRCNFTELLKSEVQPAAGDAATTTNEENGTATEPYGVEE